jgi:hypothetical protein
MKAKPKTKKRGQTLIQMHLTQRDRKLLEVLRENNRTLRNSALFRLALDTLAEKQGLLANLS